MALPRRTAGTFLAVPLTHPREDAVDVLTVSPSEAPMHSRFSSVLLASLFLGCAGASPAPEAPAPTPPPSSSVETKKEALRVVLGRAPEVVPPVPAECPPNVALPERTRCEGALDELIRGLSLGEEATIEALVPLERCDGFPEGYVRALRIELGPPACGDALAEPLVGADGTLENGPMREVLVAYGLAARLRRLAADPPVAPGTREKATLEAYFQKDLFPWMSAQASALYAMASEGVKLRGYPRGIVAIEAGMADMRFVELARAVPIPSEFEGDQELRDAYYAALDEALEQRKNRGRDAALVGLKDFREAGVLVDPRLDVARSLLARVFAGGRIDALSKLILPEFPKVREHTGATRLASLLPAPYAEPLLREEAVTKDLVLAYLERGFPLSVERALTARDDDDAKLLLGQALLRRGLTYFRAEDFRTAAALLASAAARELPRGPVALSHALATALSAGPEDAAELILRGPLFARSLGNLEPLDALGRELNSVTGAARFDSAYLREIAAPPGAPEVWKDLENRYKEAAKFLQKPYNQEAESRAQAAKATHKALTK